MQKSKEDSPKQIGFFLFGSMRIHFIVQSTHNKATISILHPTVYYNWVNFVFSFDFPVFQESTILIRSEFFYMEESN
jgi:hypothetical protein